MVVKLVQPVNAILPTVVRVGGIVTLVREVHPPNAFPPRVVRDDGNEMVEILVPAKTLSSIVTNDEGSVMLVNFVQSQK